LFPVELRLLRYFLAVADTGSTAAASDLLNTAQPSLSRQIRQLESDLGVTLFDRTGGRLRLSDAGRRLVPMARDVVLRAEDLRRQVKPPDHSHGPIVIAAPLTTITDVIAPFLVTPEAAGLLALPREVVPALALQSLADGDSDLAVSAGSVPSQFTSRVLLRPPIWAYVPRHHLLAARRSVDIAELVRLPLVLLDHQHGTRRLFDEAAADAGLTVDPRIETTLPVVAQALAAAGHGVAVVSDEPRFGLRRLRIRVHRSTLCIPLWAAWDQTRYSTEAVEHFVDVLGRYCHRHFAGPLA